MNRFDWLEFDGHRAEKQAASAHEQEAAQAGPHSYRDTARKMRRAGYFTLAANLYEKALGMQEHFYRNWAELIDCLVRAGELDEAERRAEDAIANYGQVRLFYAARALVRAHRQQYDGALTDSDISLDAGGAGWYPWCVRGELLLRMDAKNRNQALTCFETASNTADDLAEASFLGGWALLHAGFAAHAASYFAEAAHWAPTAPLYWLCLGDAFRALRLFDQALFYYERAEELDATNEIVRARRRDVAVRVYGLMHGFLAPDLRDRWKRKLEGK